MINLISARYCKGKFSIQEPLWILSFESRLTIPSFVSSLISGKFFLKESLILWLINPQIDLDKLFSCLSESSKLVPKAGLISSLLNEYPRSSLISTI